MKDYKMLFQLTDILALAQTPVSLTISIYRWFNFAKNHLPKQASKTWHILFTYIKPAYLREKVRTTNFTTSKTKKNIEKLADDHNIEKLYWSDQDVKKGKDQNIEKWIITTSKRVDHYYENQNVEKNIESQNLPKNHFQRCDHSQRHR